MTYAQKPRSYAAGRDMTAMPPTSLALDGHLPAAHALSIRAATANVADIARYEPRTIWEQDTAALPSALARYRRRVRAFAERELRPRALAMDTDAHGAEATEVLRLGARYGLLSDLLPWPFGSHVPWLYRYPIQFLTCLKMEELCATCGGLGLLLGAHVLGSAPILLTMDLATIRRHLLPAYRASKRGEPRLFGYAITEPSAGSDVEEGHGARQHAPGTTATPVQGGFRLRGRKVFISGGDMAHGVLVFAALAGQGMESWTCFLVDTKSPGFRVVRTELKMGQRASGAAELEFDDVFVPDTHVIGGVRGGWALNRITLNFSRIPVGAIALGIARSALDAATDFVCRYRLGGKELIQYQEVQLAIAQMTADTSAMRGLLWQVAARFTPTQSQASIAKSFSADRAVAVCEQAIDLLGNHALVHENRVEKAFRDARLTQIYEGTNQINRLAIIEDLQEGLLSRIPPGAPR